jgi:hypothetical protein
MSVISTNPLWRRPVLLSLVRSELALDQLKKTAPILFESKGALLRELIRTVMAVDTEPASNLLIVQDPDYQKITEGLYIPGGPTWSRLILWLLMEIESLPVPAVPEVAKLFKAWCLGLMGQDPLTPAILRQIYAWLLEIEMPEEHEEGRLRKELSRDEVTSLASDLRETFLWFCHRTPELASEYLHSFEGRRHREQSMLAILKLQSSLAQAAPKDYADFAIKALIPEKRPRRSRSHGLEREEVFESSRSEFLPVSPAQGPFFSLLTSDAAEGLRLIRTLVDHAVSFFSRGREPGGDGVTIQFPDGPRTFPWTMSYGWSREYTDAPYVVTSALMALEAWAHRRVDASEPVEAVIRDVLGDQTAPAAFLLIVVDLLISHWPKSRAAAVPYLACPELLAMDRHRIALDMLEIPDPFGIKEIQQEPMGLVSLQELATRPSRSRLLDQILDDPSNYLDHVPNEALDELRRLLEAAASRVGAPQEDSTLMDPRLMVRYALNRLDPANWSPAEVQLEDGTTVARLVYFSPAEEAEQQSSLERKTRQRRQDAQLRILANKLLELPGRANPELLTVLADWAQKEFELPQPDQDEENLAWMHEHAVFAITLIVARDGTPELRVRHRDWLLRTFRQGLATREDNVHRVRGGLKFNPAAMGFSGLVYLMQEQRSSDEIRELLRAAGNPNPAAAHGMTEVAYLLSTLDERLPRSVLRIAFRAMNKADRDWSFRPGMDFDHEKQDHELRLAACAVEVLEHIETEIGWLEGRNPEPDWPAFTRRVPHPAFGLRIRAGSEESVQEVEPEPETERNAHTDSQGAGLWLRSIEELLDTPAIPWLRTLVDAYKGWTSIANGSGFDPDGRISGEPEGWNEAFFRVVPLCLVGAGEEEVDRILSDHFSDLPEESFYDLIALFQINVDQIYFNGKLLDVSIAVKVRQSLTTRLQATHDWIWLRSQREERAGMHLAEAISVLFFIRSGGLLDYPKAYILEKGIGDLAPFLPTLRDMVVDNPSPYVGNMALILLEVSPRPEQAELVFACAETWMPIYRGDTRFWRDYGFGKRWCSIARKILDVDSTLFAKGGPRRADLDRVLAYLVTEGIPEASQLEKALIMLDRGNHV